MLVHYVTIFFFKIYFTHEMQPEVKVIVIPMFRPSLSRKKHKINAIFDFILLIIEQLYNMKYTNAFVKIVTLRKILKAQRYVVRMDLNGPRIP